MGFGWVLGLGVALKASESLAEAVRVDSAQGLHYEARVGGRGSRSPWRDVVTWDRREPCRRYGG